jgi:ferritin
MINRHVCEQMNEQIKNELESAYMYLSMAAYFQSLSLNGMAHWMRVQVHEETMHAMKFHDHIIDRGGQVVLKDMAQLRTTWESPLAAWKHVLEHEQLVTSLINKLLTVVRQESDFAAEPLMSWFVSEQVEEEANAMNIIDQIELTDSAKPAILMLDRELSARAFPAGSPYDPAAYNALT